MTKGWSSSFTDFGRRVPSPRAGPWPNLRGREEPHAAGINWDERVKGGEPGSHSGGEVGPDDRSVLKGCEVVAHYVSGKAKSAADVGYLASPVVCEILDDPRSDLVGPYFAPAVTPIIRRWSAWADCVGQFNCLSIGPYREGSPAGRVWALHRPRPGQPCVIAVSAPRFPVPWPPELPPRGAAPRWEQLCRGFGR